MDYRVHTRNVDIAEDTNSYIQKKLNSLQRKFKLISEARVEVSKEDTKAQQDQMRMQVTLNCNGSILRSEARAPSVQAAVDEIVEVLEKRIARFKGRLYKSEVAKRLGRERDIPEVEQVPAEQQTEDQDSLATGRVVRVKRFSMKPMSSEEAATTMELLGHSFFMFYNRDKGQFNVIYRRNDGNYAIIEPEPM